MGSVMPDGHLRGSRWILTRPRNRAESWHQALRSEGAEVHLAPALKMVEGASEAVRSSLQNHQKNG